MEYGNDAMLNTRASSPYIDAAQSLAQPDPQISTRLDHCVGQANRINGMVTGLSNRLFGASAKLATNQKGDGEGSIASFSRNIESAQNQTLSTLERILKAL